MRLFAFICCLAMLPALAAQAQHPVLSLHGSGHFGTEMAVQIHGAPADSLAFATIGLTRGELRVNSLLTLGVVDGMIDAMGVVPAGGALEKSYEIPASLPAFLSGTPVHVQVVTLGGAAHKAGDITYFQPSEVHTMILWANDLDVSAQG